MTAAPISNDNVKPAADPVRRPGAPTPETESASERPGMLPRKDEAPPQTGAHPDEPRDG